MNLRALGNTGLKISVLSVGGSGFGNVYGCYSEKAGAKAIQRALDLGLNYFDTAYWYGQGQSENFLGKVLQGVSRDKFILSTKVGRYEQNHGRMFNFSAEKVTQSAHDSLRRMQLDYIDILHVHDVEFAPSVDIILHETLPALQQLQRKGICRFIGITGYPLSLLKLITAESYIPIDCILSYCRLTLHDSSLTDYFKYFTLKKIGIINASPVGMGLLTPNGTQPWHPASTEVQKACHDAVKFCQQQGVDIAKLAINFSTSFKEVSTTLVSMTDEATVKHNVDATTHQLTEHETCVRDYIVQNYLIPVRVKHWEGIEVEKYRRKIAKY